MEKFGGINAVSAKPSKAEILQFLDTFETKRAAESAYKWITDESSQKKQIHEQMSEVRSKTRKSAKIAQLVGYTQMNLWEVLSNLAQVGERAGLTIKTSVQTEKLVFEIGNIPEDKAATLLIQELLAIVFARLSNVESYISHTKDTTTATISMKSERT